LSARLEGRPALRSELRVEDKVRDERCGHTRREPNLWLSANYVDGWERVKKESAPPLAERTPKRIYRIK
jgi:hypothetical protein